MPSASGSVGSANDDGTALRREAPALPRDSVVHSTTNRCAAIRMLTESECHKIPLAQSLVDATKASRTFVATARGAQKPLKS